VRHAPHSLSPAGALHGGIRLQSPAACGVLAGDPVLKSIEGGDPFAPDAQTYAAVAKKCAAKEPVVLVTTDGRTLAARCEAPLPPEPLAYSVERWMPSQGANLAPR
jgi:hypothetical protein